MRRVVATLALALVITGCSHKPFTGTVVTRRVDPAHEETNYVQVGTTFTYDEKGNLTGSNPQFGWVDEWVPERYYVTLRGCHNDKGKCVRREFQVSSVDYLHLTEGEETTFR